MPRIKETNRKDFTFIWLLENFEYCWQKTGSSLKSPTFVVQKIERSKWSLSIKPRGYDSDRWISLYLRREEDSLGPPGIELDYEMAIVASDGTVLSLQREYGHTFLKDGSWGFPNFEEREKIFADRTKFLPQGVLEIRCRMWMSKEKAKKYGLSIARSRIVVERISFFRQIERFSSSRKKGKKKTFKITWTSNDNITTALKVFLERHEKSFSLCIELINLKKSIEFSKFKVFVIDSERKFENFGQHEFLLSSVNKSPKCVLSFKKESFMNNKSLYLPNDTLKLYFEFAFATGDKFEGIEVTNYECSDSLLTKHEVAENIKIASHEKSDSVASDLKKDFGSLLDEKLLCDVMLCTKSESFPAHWVVLISRSPVFRAMFKSDVNEKSRDRIDMEDLKPDTVRRMLKYMYTDTLERLQWESASDLYAAAEKYEIMSLKDKCSSFLKANLSNRNACKVLLLADLYQDNELKSTAQDFILINEKITKNPVCYPSLLPELRYIL